MNSATELLDGASAVIDAWLLQSTPSRSVRPLQGALEIGGRALLSVQGSATEAAERYRHTLLRLQTALPAIEETFRLERQILLEQGEALNRAARWMQERKRTM